MLYGTIMGSMESATEWIGAKLTTGVGKAFFKSGAVEGLKALGLDIAENFFEEAIMEPIQEVVKQAIGKDGDWQGIGKRMLQSGINGALTSIIMGGASAGIGKASNLVFKMQSGQQITQEEIADTLKEINKSEEVDIEKILANNFKFTAEDLAVNLDAQQRTEQRLDEVAETLTRNEAQQLLINESDLDDTQKEVLSEIASQYNLSDKDVKKAIENTKQGKYTQNNEVLNQSEQTIQEGQQMAQNETSQEQRDLIQDLQKFNETRQEGQEIFDLDNEENVKEVQAIQKVAEKRGINITFDESRFDNTDTNAFYEYDKDGNVANIVLNPNSTSKKYVQNLVIHEMTHSFEGSKEYNNLSKAILDYAKKTGEYDKAFQDLKNTYSSVYKGDNIDSIVEKEAVANILGEKLGDKEFVDSLVNNQYVERSTIQKIIDFVKNQINRFKGYKDQEAYWNHVKTLFEDAYNKSEVSQEGLKDSIKRYSINGDGRDFFYRGQEKEGKELSYNSTGFVGLKDGGYFFTPNKETANKYGQNIIERYRNEENTVTVKESNELQKMATEKLNEDMKNGIWTEEDDLLEQMSLGRSKAFAEYTGKPFVETGDKFGEDAEAIYYPEFDKESNIKENTPTKDSQGRELSKQQQEYFKNSKVRDENGNLLEVYHGTNNEFTEFDSKKFGKYTGKLKGIWLTDKIINANAYGNNIIQSYANIQNPGSATEVTMNKEQYTELLKNVDVKDTNINSSWEHFKSENDFEILTHIQRLYENKGKTLQEFYNDVINITGIDGIYDEKYLADGSPIWIAFNSNQIKKISNENPTTNPDIRYSQDTTGAWNNFMEKYFKNEGEGTAIQDMKKLPEKLYNKADFQEVLDNAQYLSQEQKNEMLSEIEGERLTKEILNSFKEVVNVMNNAGREEFENEINRKLSKQEINKLYSTYRNKATTYKKGTLNTALEVIKGNRYGRNKEQWLKVAELAGEMYSDEDLSLQELNKVANESWFDLAPNTKSQLNRQGEKFVKFDINDWRKSFFDGVKGNRQFSMETENQENIEQPTQEVELPKANKILNPTEISNLTPEDASTTPELPNKIYKEGSKVSNFVSNIENDVGFLTDEQKQDILKEENVKYYAEVTNADTLAKAYENLKENGKEATYEWYAKKTENATAEDVATGWILLKQYADKGDTKGMVNVAKKLRDIGTKAGQTVQAFNILSRLTPEGMVAYTQSELQDAYNEMIKGKTKKWIDQHKADFDLTQEEVAFIMDTMQNLPEENLATNNYERKVALGQIQKLFTDKMPTENSKIKSWMRISMLFNPKTQVRNIAGNAGVIPVNMVSDFLGSKADKFISKYTGVRTLGNTNVKSYLKGMKDGFYQSYNDFRQGINTRDIEQNRFEFGQGKAFSDKGLGKALNSVDNMLNFVMDFGDRGFYQASFVNSLNNQMLLNGTTTPTQDMIDIATQEALSRTWNDNNEYTNFVLGIRRWLNKMVGTKNYGLGDVLIPFAKTPANLTKAIVEYSPVGLTKSILDIPNIKNAIETGQITAQQQHQFADHLGKGLAGTMLYVLGYALANAGITTGEPDKDKDVKNFMRYSLGISPYSVKIGNKSFTYDWSQPVATPLAIMSNLAQQNQKNPDASLLDKTLSAVNIGTNQLLEQSFMESLNEVLNGNGDITERLTKAVFDLPVRAIPTFSKQIADLVDGTQRTSFEYGEPSQTAINSVKAKLPVKSEELAPSVDTLGNDIQKYGGENNWFNVFFNPANMNKGQTSKEAEEIYRVYEETGDTTVFPITAPYYIDKDGGRINMDSQTRAEYQRTTGNYTKSIVKELLNDEDYKKLSDPDKAKVLKQVVTDSNEKAKRDVLNINNDSSDLDLIDEVGSDYYTYKLSEKGKSKQPEKCEVLLNKDYSNKNKQLIYSSEINKDDKTYNGLLQINKNLNMNDYLGFKAQTFEGENKKQDMTNYLENSNLSREEQLYILGKNYKLNASQKQELENLLRNKMPSNDIISVLESIK